MSVPDPIERPHEIQLCNEQLTTTYYCHESDCSIECQIGEKGVVNSKELSNYPTDFSNDFSLEGMVDLQVNGFAGIDFNLPSLTADKLDYSLAEMALTGVTTCLPTLITGSSQHLTNTLACLDTAVSESRLGRYMVAGYHIEGPFLSHKDGFSGAHDPKYMTDANIELIDEMSEIAKLPIRLITVAPEIPKVIDLISILVERGVQVSIGHSAATPHQINAAVEAGATLSTHLGNGLPQTMHKTDNTIFWQLAHDGLNAMFIADGIHIPIPALKVMLSAKGADRSILTTDAVSAAGRNLTPGRYTLGSIEIELSSDKSVRKPGTVNLAGSSTNMGQMMCNLMQWFNYSIREVLQLAQVNPSKVLGIESTTGKTKNELGIVEWFQSRGGPKVRRAHIGPYTVINLLKGD